MTDRCLTSATTSERIWKYWITDFSSSFLGSPAAASAFTPPAAATSGVCQRAKRELVRNRLDRGPQPRRALVAERKGALLTRVWGQAVVEVGEDIVQIVVVHVFEQP